MSIEATKNKNETYKLVFMQVKKINIL